jgi:hypothetical protein
MAGQPVFKCIIVMTLSQYCRLTEIFVHAANSVQRHRKQTPYRKKINSCSFSTRLALFFVIKTELEVQVFFTLISCENE